MNQFIKHENMIINLSNINRVDWQPETLYLYIDWASGGETSFYGDTAESLWEIIKAHVAEQ